jgi:hypothetical protein
MKGSALFSQLKQCSGTVILAEKVWLRDNIVPQENQTTNRDILFQ